MLSCSGLHAGYGRLAALRGVDFAVAAGDLRVVIGPNGAGKTSLLRAIFGLIKPWQGRIELDGKNVAGAQPTDLLALGLAYVPQEPSIFPQLSVEDNLEMGLFQMRVRDSARIEEVFSRFELLARRRKISAQSLSGGERRLLEIGRALMIRPRLLLLDEPSLGLSPVMLQTILRELRRVNGEGVTIVLVEQRIRAALTVAKSLSVLRLGRIVYSGTADVTRDPRQLANLLYGATRDIEGAVA